MPDFPATQAKTTTLDNGLVIITDDQVDAPVVSCQIWVETGSMHEYPQLGSGISHLLEHMVFKGTGKYTGTELADTVQAAGGQWNAYTSFDRTVYYIDGPADSVHTFLDVLCEMVFRPSFPEVDFELERDVIRREIDMGLDSPQQQAMRLLFSTVYQKDSRRHPVIGHLPLFDALTYNDMVDYHARRYAPANVFISVSGQIDTTDVVSKIRELTPDGWSRFDDSPIVPREPRQLGQRVKRKNFAVPASSLTLAWQTPGLDDDDSTALDLLSTVLGAGRSSLLYRRLREERQLCHHIGASHWSPPQGPGVFTVSAEVDADGRDTLQDAILEQILQAQASQLDDALQRAKRMTLASQFHTLTTASGRAGDLASNWHETRNLNYTHDYVTSLEQVTVADLRRVAARYLVPSQLTITSLDPEDTTETVAPEISSLPVQADGIERHTLGNGLSVVLGRDSRLPLITANLCMLAGRPAERAENAGVGNLLASVMDKGCRSYEAEEIAKKLDAAGASMSFYSGNNTFGGKLGCLAEDAADMVALFAEVVTEPTLPEDAIEREKSAILTGIAAAREKPLSEAMRLNREQLFGAENYGLSGSGSEESVAGLDRLSLSAHHSLHVRAANACLAIFGDFDPAVMLGIVESAFSSWESGEKYTLPVSEIHPGEEVTLTLDKKQAALVFGYATGGLRSGDEAILELLQSYTSDMSGPIFGRIREELGLAYTASSSLWHGLDRGMYAFYLATAPEQMKLAEKELRRELELIASDGIPEEKFGSALNSLMASDSLSNQTNSARAALSSVDTLLGYEPDRFLRRADSYKQITPADVQRVAREVLSQAPVITRVSP